MESLSFVKISSILGFGILGVALRFGINELIRQKYNGVFPLSTFLINLLGSFLIGCVYVTCFEKGRISEWIGIGLMVGFLGGFTTFSAFSLDTLKLIENGQRNVALLYFVFSPIFAVMAAFLGVRLIRYYA